MPLVPDWFPVLPLVALQLSFEPAGRMLIEEATHVDIPSCHESNPHRRTKKQTKRVPPSS